MLAIVICLSVVVMIAMVILSVILYNFMLLTSEMNKRLVYIVADVLGSISLETPHIDTMFREPNIEDDLFNDESDEHFNPHNFDPLKIEENE